MNFERVAPGVIAIDTEFGRPRMAASYLLIDGGHAAFVDVGTSHSRANLLATLAAQELDVDAVDYVILTHVHLDHAGGAGQLMRELPRARLLVHPRGVAHIVDPTLLAAATAAVYGEERFAAEYGELLGVARERVEAAVDEHRVPLGDRTLEFIHTPGHALHHLCIVDRDTAEVFTGDSFGISYREFDTAAGAFIFPTTSPTQFDPDQLHASIDRIMAYRPAAAYLTHYGRVVDLVRLSADLHADIDAFVRMAQSAANESQPTQSLEERLFEHLAMRLDEHEFTGDVAAQHAVLDADMALNAAGLEAWFARRRASSRA
jgi:glyoxylase-like metal-dependent hydrolase (beta-lactamase superfamily II)